MAREWQHVWCDIRELCLVCGMTRELFEATQATCTALRSVNVTHQFKGDHCQVCGRDKMSVLTEMKVFGKASPCVPPKPGLLVPDHLAGHFSGNLLFSKPNQTVGLQPGLTPPAMSDAAVQAAIDALKTGLQQAQYMALTRGSFLLPPELPSLLPPRRNLEVVKRETPPIGYRAWNLSWQQGEAMLLSPIKGHQWETPILRAEAKPSPWNVHQMRRGVHGIYAYKHLWQLDSTELVFGRVALHGTVIEHELGYRAEVAVIEKLYVRQLYDQEDLRMSSRDMYVASGDWTYTNIVEALAKRYECEATLDLTDWILARRQRNRGK